MESPPKIFGIEHVSFLLKNKRSSVLERQAPLMTSGKVDCTEHHLGPHWSRHPKLEPWFH